MIRIDQSTLPFLWNKKQNGTCTLAAAPTHFDYISGPKAECWKGAVEKGILDVHGFVTQEHQEVPLLPLNSEEIKLISEELEKPFVVQIEGEEPLHISMGEILRKLRENKGNVYRFKELQLIGGYVTYLLFHKTDYAKRIFEKLGIGELYQATQGREPPDLDLRQQVERLFINPVSCSQDTFYPSNSNIDPNDLTSLKSSVILHICQSIEKGSFKPRLDEKVEAQAFEELITANDYLNRFQLISFKNSPFDLVFYGILQRESIFTSDSISLFIDDILMQPEKQTCSPFSSRTFPLQAFFDYYLRFIRAKAPHLIDETGWLKFLSLMSAKGHTSMQSFSSLEKPLEEVLFAKLNEKTSGDWLHLQGMVRTWFDKHHPNDPLAQMFFILNACILLEKKGFGKAAEILLKDLDKLKLEGVAADIHHLIVDQKIPLLHILDFLHVASFLIYTRNSPSKEVSIEIATEDFLRPITQFRLGNATLHLRGNVLDAFKNLALHQEKWKCGEQALAKFFMRLCPPSSCNSRIDAKLADSLGVYGGSLEDRALDMANSDSHLLKYIGIVCYSNLEGVDPKSKQRLAETHAWDLLDSLNGAVDAIALKEQLSLVVGPLPETQEEWITTLFEPQRGSGELALLTLKRMVENEKGLEFTAKLISTLTQTQPGYALRIYTYLKSKNLLTKNKFLTVILECIDRVKQKKAEAINAEDVHLLIYLGKDLPLFLKGYKPSVQKAKTAAQTLQWYIRWLSDSKEKTISQEIKQSFTQLRKNPQFEQAWLSNQLGNKEKTSISLKDLNKAAKDPKFSRQTLFLHLLHYFKQMGEKAELSLTKHFKECLSKSSSWEKSKQEELAGALVDFLEHEGVHQTAISSLLKEMKTFIACAAKKKFVSEEQLCTLVGAVVTSCTEICNTTKKVEWLDLATHLIVTYPSNLKTVEQATWIGFFMNAGRLMRTKVFTLFSLLEEHALLSPDKNRAIYQKIYAIVVFSFFTEGHASKEITLLIKDPAKFRRIYATIEDQEIALRSLSYLLIGCTLYVGQEEVPFLVELYGNICNLFNKVYGAEKVYLNTKVDYYRVKAWVDISYVKLLIAYRKEALELTITKIGESAISLQPTYQENCYVLIQQLSSREEFYEIADRVLKWLDLRKIDWPQTIALHNDTIPGVMGFIYARSASTIRTFRSMQLWHNDLVNLNAQQKMIPEGTWNLGYCIILELLTKNNNAFEEEIGDTLDWIRSYWKTNPSKFQQIEQLQKILSLHLPNKKIIIPSTAIYPLTFLETDLLFFGQATQSQHSKACNDTISYTLLNLPPVYSSPKGEQILENLMDAIVNSNRFNSIDVYPFARLFWENVQCKLFLSSEKCFSYKHSFISKMLKMANEPFSDRTSLMKTIEWCLDTFKANPLYQPWEKEITELNKHYQAAQKNDL